MDKIIDFKYKGKRYVLKESNLAEIEGVRLDKWGRTILLINKNLSPYKRNLALHRLITGRGLRTLQNKKSYMADSMSNMCPSV
ncbi:hypothetical protein KPL28_00140 [Clostridium algidicarnis]|uniref:hypothetical protein n=1 Tax=Clostridium algidicarnis TaxID=37659 RepID=UPI001C0B614E|nr:hypothetical protein [Clostridium algidicarnis]MBU3208040.1 hypothetical protein [Clostridium algidicarnis]